MMETIFVGGAPRTGTSALQALICTSERVNPYVGECSYLSSLVTAYDRAKAGYEHGAAYYFSSEEAFAEFNRDQVRRALRQFRRHLGRPEVLCLKDPLLTGRFHRVAELAPAARFVVSVRDPIDALNSRVRVHLAMMQITFIKERQLRKLCNEFTRCYADLPNYAELLRDRLVLLEYDSLVKSDYIGQLSFLGISDVRPDLIWKNAKKDHASLLDSPWNTPLYTQHLTPFSADREQILSMPQRALVNEICGPAVEALRNAFRMEPA